VDLGNEWHFNKIVYKEQVQNKALTVEDGDKESLATVRYNEIVSESVFSICPEGAGPNTLRIWESMAVGSIPIILARGWLPPQRMNVDLEDCCVFVDPENVETVFTLLSKIDEARVNELSRKCISNYQTFRFLDTFRSK
jgi:hypothetical protein